MSGNEAMAIEWAFGLATGMMALGAVIGLAGGRGRNARKPEIPDAAPTEGLHETMMPQLPETGGPPGKWTAIPQESQPGPPPLPPAGEKAGITETLRGKVHPPAIVPVDLVGVMVVALVYFGFFMMALQAPPPDGAAALSVGDIVASVVTQGMILGSVLIMVAPRCNPVRFFGLRWRRWPWVFLIAPVVTFFVLTLFGTLESFGYSEWMRDKLDSEPLQRTVMVLRESKDPVLLGLMAFTAVVVAPLCEEMVFRGYVYPVVKRYGGMWVAAIGSALLFSAAHSHAAGLLPLFLLGLVLVAVYELTGSLWASIAVHACFNAVTVGTTFWMRINDLPFPPSP